jgi:hypothetical protein
VSRLEIDMHPDGLNQHRPAIFVISRVVDELKVERIVDSAPRMQVVVALEDVFAGVVQLAVAQQKAQTAKLQVRLMIRLDSIRNKSHAEPVERARPRSSGIVAAELDSLVDFRVSKGFVLALVPANAGKGAQIRRQLLLRVEGEAVLHRAERLVLGDVRRRIFPRDKGLVGDAIKPHMRVVDVAQDPDDTLAIWRKQAAEQRFTKAA